MNEFKKKIKQCAIRLKTQTTCESTKSVTCESENQADMLVTCMQPCNHATFLQHNKRSQYQIPTNLARSFALC